MWSIETLPESPGNKRGNDAARTQRGNEMSKNEIKLSDAPAHLRKAAAAEQANPRPRGKRSLWSASWRLAQSMLTLGRKNGTIWGPRVK